ncbi:MAG: hypothetical protein JSU03_02015 [Bacteroidetes bacterium]|nr:hypothetical protein [Bacteroidota bacterium]
MAFLKKYTGLLLVFIFPLQLLAQDITGVWKGSFYVDSTKMTFPFELSISENKGRLTGYSRISFEENGIPQVVYRDHNITKQGDQYIVVDKSEITKASSVEQPKEVKKTMIMLLSIKDSVMTLQGEWSTNKTRRYLAARGTVMVQHKNDYRQTDIFKKLAELHLSDDLSFNKPEEKPDFVLAAKTELPQANTITNKKSIEVASKVSSPSVAVKLPLPEQPRQPEVVKPAPKPAVKAPAPVIVKNTAPPPVKTVITKPVVKNTAAPIVPKPVVIASAPKPVAAQNMVSVSKTAAVEVNERNNSSVKSIYYTSDSLQLTLYDNGEIDGDTVSVLLNGKVIIAKQRLDIKPNVHTIYFDKDTPDSMMLVMYAENLGSIPPNTGLLVIHDGKAVYEVRFSADFKTNAAIILRRKKNQ